MSGPIHRRATRQRSGGTRLLASLFVLLLLAFGLAACGDDDDGGDDAAGGDTGSETTGGGDGDGDDGADAGGGDVAAQLQELLGVEPDAPENGAGEEFRMGAVLALTGPGSFYGKTMSRGIDLAVKHIKAAGGPDFQVKYYDHKSGDAAAGQQAITELGENGYPAKLASYADNLGSMLPGTEQYKVFTLDGGGGTSIFAQNKPFFWGARAITPNDVLPGLFEYITQEFPDVETVGLTGWDVGEPSNGIVKKDVLQKIEDAGLEHNGLYELTPVGSQDYSQVLPKIKDNEPDLLLVGMYGQDIGSFINQAQTAGLESEIVGFEFTPDGVNASKGTFEQGYTFSYDYFDPNNPTNPLAELFVEQFREEYGEDPDFYAANYYEDTLVMWELVRRVLADGGDINSGEDLDAALRSDLSVVSIYGGDDSTPGVMTFDEQTHSVKERPMGVFRYEGGEVQPLAYFNLNAQDFELAE